MACSGCSKKRKEVAAAKSAKQAIEQQIAKQQVAKQQVTIPKTAKGRNYAWTGAYKKAPLILHYRDYGENVFGAKVIRESDFKEKLAGAKKRLELMIFDNLTVERSAIRNKCRLLGIDTIHSEAGWFPHYSTVHVDPLGFCWESSLPRLTFRKLKTHHKNTSWLFRGPFRSYKVKELPDSLKEPYVLWPLQLIGDRVNQYACNVRKWDDMIRHFRACLPEEIQLVIKDHPRGETHDKSGILKLSKELPNCLSLNKKVDLTSLIINSNGAAGVNSTVLYETRLVFNKPVYIYSDGWFTNHTELFTPVYFCSKPRPLNGLEYIESPGKLNTTARLKDYRDWYLYQLLIRQYHRQDIKDDPQKFVDWVHKFTYKSYIKYGEELFD